MFSWFAEESRSPFATQKVALPLVDFFEAFNNEFTMSDFNC